MDCRSEEVATAPVMLCVCVCVWVCVLLLVAFIKLKSPLG